LRGDLELGYRISHPQLEIELKFEKVDKLHIHEEIIPEMLDHLTEKIKNDACIKHPVIVDKETLVVLDGMHRVAAVQRLGYQLMLVCLVDYMNPSITVERWFRSVKDGGNASPVEILTKSGYKLEPNTREGIEKLMKERKAIAGVLTSHSAHAVLGQEKNVKKAYDRIRDIELKLREAGYEIEYDTVKDALVKLDSGEVSAIIAVPMISKQEIIDTALAGEVFIPKATRHLIPARPLFVDAPMEWLKLDLKKANELLVEHLSKKRVKHLPGGQVLDRRYEEELYIFE